MDSSSSQGKAPSGTGKKGGSQQSADKGGNNPNPLQKSSANLATKSGENPAIKPGDNPAPTAAEASSERKRPLTDEAQRFMDSIAAEKAEKIVLNGRNKQHGRN